jgi:hypothetical protein
LVNTFPARELKTADYSPAGPSAFNVVKPDLLAPATSIVAADGQKKFSFPSACRDRSALSQGSGTSLAAAYVAGAALLVQQYFQEEHGFRPGGDLIRAALAATADSRVVNLTNIDQPMRFFEGMPIRRGEHLVWEVGVVSGARALRIAIAYRDLHMRSYGLFVDLDLFVRLPNGVTVYGNQRPNDREERFSTVEMIAIPQPIVGGFEVHVVCSGLADVTFSMVLMGLIDTERMFTPSHRPGRNCSGGTIGVNCQISPIKISDIPRPVALPPNSIEYLRVDRPPINFTEMLIVFNNSQMPLVYCTRRDRQPLLPVEYSHQFENVSETFELLVDRDFEYIGIAILNANPGQVNISVGYIMDPAKVTRSPGATPPPTRPSDYFTAMVVGWVLVGLFLPVVVTIGIYAWMVRRPHREAHEFTEPIA